jgi:hypothetical protein
MYLLEKIEKTIIESLHYDSIFFIFTFFCLSFNHDEI